MSGLAIYFSRTPASKRMFSSPSPSESPSKRRRFSPAIEAPTAATRTDWHAVYLQPNSSLNSTSPASPTEFVTPPDSCELACSPSPSQNSWVQVVPVTSSSWSENQDSDGSTVFSGSSLNLVPAVVSFPNPPFNGDNPPSTTLSPRSHASSEACTPAKAPCPQTCYCQLDVQMDTFGNRSDVERVQLTQKISPAHDGSAVSRMLFPRSTWNMFRTFASSESVPPNTRHFVYRGGNNRGHAVTVENEDLWMDEKNPFLLTQFDLRQEEHFNGTIIPTTSSLNLL